MQRTVIKTTKEWVAIKTQWHQLLAQIPDHTIFMTWEWQYYWWHHYAEKFNNPMLRIATYYVDGKLVAILPYFLYTERFGPIALRKASYLGSKIESSDYLDVIVAPTYKEFFLKNLDTEIRTLVPEADIIELNNCLPESIFYHVYGYHTNGEVFTETYRVCPYVSLPSSFDGYLKQLSSNFRYNVRRKVKKLIQKTGVRFELWENLAEANQVVEDIFELHARRAKQKGLNTKFKRSLRLAFHQDVVRELVPKGYVKIFHLITSQNEKIAGMYCFDYNHTLAYFQAGFDPQWANFSPGLVMLAKTIEYAINQGYQIFDFMRGGEAYKKNWGTKDRFIYLITVPNSARGKAYLHYYKIRKWVAPRVKRILAKRKE